MPLPQHESKTRLLDATLKVVRAKGYNATRIEDVCAEAGLTKGSFFHHFKSKDDLALSAIAHWTAHVTEFFASAPYHDKPDPLDRLIAYVDFRKSLLTGPVPEFTCFAGTVVQEIYETHPELRAACENDFYSLARTLEADVREAMQIHKVRSDCTAESVALFIQCVTQGAFVMAKATQSSAVAAQNLDHLRRYLELLFDRTAKPRTTRKPESSRGAR
jgi:TetR/AcrR family transcriptional regulator, transcriptional repressor for nem operon